MELIIRFISDFWEIIPGDKIVEFTKFMISKWEDFEKENPISEPSNDSIRLEEEAKQIQATFERNKGKILLPNKFYPAVEPAIREKLKMLNNQKTDVPMKEVVVTALQGLNPDIPGEKIVALVAYALEYWQHLQSPGTELKASKRQVQTAAI